MNKGKRRCVLALILASFCVQASDTGRLQQALRPWHPLAVTRRHDTVTVILNEDRVTPARYKEVIGKGVCAGIWRRRAPSRYLASVSQMQVLNRFHTRGYVLVGPGALCNRMGLATGQRALLILQSHTLLY
ncbi:TPA: hypothetical protein NPN33_004715 [Klebsiella variicola subsp. variicola]|uniref:Uncharacterized protein n=1 Tax=Klebsiella variicola TaxID=244366 RepID=A0A9P0VJX1_KLEVA|nr:hypothetical protein [Klebsiella variicola]NKD41392.1 hypothetical protein [Escherichia coli]HCI6001200.1 hypothetical protein [Klebsiella variicola subsp. variicola]MCH6141584.1 hypothetical protein [Klebsiella variicola]MCH6176612.1 hypothetical protein [Klebsiella variicola]NWO61505.1 hypothetical protein [Klebsiella variicola]